MNRKIQRVQYNETTKRVTLQWKTKPLDRVFQNASYDLAVVTVPMPLVRTWRLPGFSDLLSTAIDSYTYDQVCKVALQFKTRFWEHSAAPIYGSCSTTTDIPGIGSICYPSYDINSTGPGVMLASYTSSDDGLRWASTPENVHVQYVVDAMAEIHGDVVYDQYSELTFSRLSSLSPSHTDLWSSWQLQPQVLGARPIRDHQLGFSNRWNAQVIHPGLLQDGEGHRHGRRRDQLYKFVDR
jgi:monoamine oxidase